MSHFYHKKSLGQNFLNNKKILEKISKIKNLRNEYVVEIGPGKVLSGLVKRINADMTVQSISTPKDVEVFFKSL